MTKDLVLDASAALAVARGEPIGTRVESAIVETMSAGAAVIVPDHFWLECVNVLSRKHHWDGEAITEALHRFDTFEPRTIRIDRPMLLRAIDIAERHGLTPYDATYLAIARVEDAMLVTLDRELAREAADRTVPLDDGHRLHDGSVPYEHDVTWPRYREISAYLAELRADVLADR